MGVAELEVYPPASMNAAPGKGTRGAGMGRHKAKKALERDLHLLLLAASVPRPIPGGRVRATAEVPMPVARRRDEGNYRTALEKALGDALCPHDPDARRWLPDDTPAHYTFGAVSFGQTELIDPPPSSGPRRRPAVCRIRLVWGEDLAAELERELEALRQERAA